MPKSYTGSARADVPFDSASTATATSVAWNRKRRLRDAAFRAASVPLAAIYIFLGLGCLVVEILALVLRGTWAFLALGIWAGPIPLWVTSVTCIITIAPEKIRNNWMVALLVTNSVAWFLLTPLFFFSLWGTITDSWGDQVKSEDCNARKVQVISVPVAGRVIMAAVKDCVALVGLFALSVHIVLQIRYLNHVTTIRSKSKGNIPGSASYITGRRTGSSMYAGGSMGILSPQPTGVSGRLQLNMQVPPAAGFAEMQPDQGSKSMEGQAIYANTESTELPPGGGDFGAPPPNYPRQDEAMYENRDVIVAHASTHEDMQDDFGAKQLLAAALNMAHMTNPAKGEGPSSAPGPGPGAGRNHQSKGAKGTPSNRGPQNDNPHGNNMGRAPQPPGMGAPSGPRTGQHYSQF